MILLELFFTFLKIGLFTIGSGYSMLFLAQRYLVESYKWLTIEEFTDIVSMSEVTPGPIIVNLATFVGSKVAGIKGSLVATIGLTIIPFLCIYLISINYDKFKDHIFMQKIMKVLRPMAIGFITVAILKLFKTSIIDIRSAVIAVIVIIITYVFNINPIYTVITGVLFALFLL